MSFLHSAFIENTPEAREWLESIGYKLADERDDFEGLQTNPIGFNHPNGTYRTCYFKPILIKKSMYVNCLGNFKLFKAITALRDDSDYKQWFKIPKPEFNKHEFSTHTLLEIDSCTYLACSDMNKVSTDCGARKATLEELIEHFKTKKI